MKKALSLLLTVMISLAVLCGVTVDAESKLPEYTPIPGFTAFSAEGLVGQNNPTASFTGFSDEGLAVFAKNKDYTYYGWGVCLYTFQKLSFLNSESEPTWSVKDNIDGTDIFGDTGLSFENADGVSFYVEVNGEPYNGSVEITCCQTPAKGPFYGTTVVGLPSTEGEGDPVVDGWDDKPKGFAYRGTVAAREGVCSFDFSKDFVQYDWWSIDDEGVNHYDDGGRSPIPASKIALINGFEIVLKHKPEYAFEIDTVAVGDFKIVKGKAAPIESMAFYADGFELGNMPEDVSVTNNSENVEIAESCVFREDLINAPIEAGQKYILSIELKANNGFSFENTAPNNIILELSTGKELTARSIVVSNKYEAAVFFDLPILGLPGDLDGDGEVTVADALAALRAAAKLTPPVKSAGASFDFDGDGEVTVADALAILRIAAKHV